MASPTVQVPREDRDQGKHCGGTQETETVSTTPCEGWAGTKYGDRQFLNGPGTQLNRSNHIYLIMSEVIFNRGAHDLDYFEMADFHHYEGSSLAFELLESRQLRVQLWDSAWAQSSARRKFFFVFEPFKAVF